MKTTHPRSPLAMVVLALLEEGPMHAYRMQRLLKQRAKHAVVNIARSNSVYQAIERLQREELLRIKATHTREAGPGRIVYELTPKGRTTLFQWLETMLSTPAREFPEFPAALAVLAIMSPSVVRTQLAARAERVEQALARVAADEQRAKEFGLPRLFLLEEEYRSAVARAELAWLRSVVADLDSGELSWTAEFVRSYSEAMEPEEAPEAAELSESAASGGPSDGSD